MTGFTITAAGIQPIRFNLYFLEAPVTVKAFLSMLPFSRLFIHARVSGQEIWVDQGHTLDIIQENASVFTEPGEIVLGPLNPARAQTSKCIGIYYGEGRGLDSCNIFGKVMAEDLHLLKALGEKIWMQGAQELFFQKSE